MAKKDCRTGTKWDILINNCVEFWTDIIAEPEPELLTEPAVELQLTAAQADSAMVLSLSLWIFVVLAVLGSILALTFWFIICRRPSRRSNTLEDAGLQQEPLQKTEPPGIIYPRSPETNSDAEMLQRAARPPPFCPHFHHGGQTGSKWEEGFITCRDSAKHAGTEEGGGLPACSMMREHRVPLPATELGGTALVTTKTV